MGLQVKVGGRRDSGGEQGGEAGGEALLFARSVVGMFGREHWRKHCLLQVRRRPMAASATSVREEKGGVMVRSIRVFRIPFSLMLKYLCLSLVCQVLHGALPEPCPGSWDMAAIGGVASGWGLTSTQAFTHVAYGTRPRETREE